MISFTKKKIQIFKTFYNFANEKYCIPSVFWAFLWKYFFLSIIILVQYMIQGLIHKTDYSVYLKIRKILNSFIIFER